MSDLNARLLAAHAAQDGAALVDLYEQAACEAAEARAAGFYRTQAYIYALELGHPKTASLHAQLKANGRES